MALAYILLFFFIMPTPLTPVNQISKVLNRSQVCLFRSQVCPYNLQVLTDVIANLNVFSFIWTPCERNKHTCERFKTFTFV